MRSLVNHRERASKKRFLHISSPRSMSEPTILMRCPKDHQIFARYSDLVVPQTSPNDLKGLMTNRERPLFWWDARHLIKIVRPPSDLSKLMSKSRKSAAPSFSNYLPRLKSLLPNLKHVLGSMLELQVVHFLGNRNSKNARKTTVIKVIAIWFPSDSNLISYRFQDYFKAISKRDQSYLNVISKRCHRRFQSESTGISNWFAGLSCHQDD